MARIVQVKHQGKVFAAEPVPVEESTERWTIIQLEDGTTIRLKPVITDVVRVTGQYDNEGQPMYIVKSANIMSVVAPESLRKDVQEISEEIH